VIIPVLLLGIAAAAMPALRMPARTTTPVMIQRFLCGMILSPWSFPCKEIYRQIDSPR
jgi:hypothetical protein